MIQPPKKVKRPDTPLAPTPIPQHVAEGVVVSKKDEKANPQDFKYLKKK
jgi:hypothetical protein